MCDEHVNVISTVPDPDPNLDSGGGGQLSNEFNSTLTGEARGEGPTPNTNECHSTLFSVTRGMYKYPYIPGVPKKL